MTEDELALDTRDHAIIAAVRGLDEPGAPDWAALEASIQAATTRAPRHRARYAIGAAVGVAALAAALAFYLGRSDGGLHLPALAIVAPPGPPDTARPDEARPDETLPDEARPDEALPDEARPDEARPDEVATVDDDGDLGAMGEIDDALIDRVIALEPVDDDVSNEADDLPAVGAAWTAWLDDFSDDDLELAMRWLDTQEAT